MAQGPDQAGEETPDEAGEVGRSQSVRVVEDFELSKQETREVTEGDTVRFVSLTGCVPVRPSA